MIQNKLREVAFKVIDREGLPVPKDIKFRYKINGKQKTNGVCYKTSVRNNKKEPEYIITLSLTEFIYTPDKFGMFIDKEGITFNKDIKHRSQEQLISVLAHEIAHLKFWNHSSEHLSYTKYLEEQIKIQM